MPLATERSVWIMYMNHRGLVQWRHVRPITMFFGTSPWHEQEQWLLKCHDLDKNEERTFAMNNVYSWRSECPEMGEGTEMVR